MFVPLVFCLLSWGVSASLNESTWRWGPFRPNLLVGLRPTIPDSLLMGLMWGDGENEAATLKTLRSTCEENDGLGSYGWTAYDARVGGTHVIHDTKHGLDLTTEFIKSSDGESWRLRVKGDLRPGASRGLKTAVIFHVATESAYPDLGSFPEGRSLSCAPGDTTGSADSESSVFASCAGKHPELGNFQLTGSIRSSASAALGSSAVRSVWAKKEDIWKAASSYRASLQRQAESEPADGNIHFLEGLFQGSFVVDFTYHPKSKAPTFSSDLSELNTQSGLKVNEAFPRKGPFYAGRYDDFMNFLMSNLVGGLGFFHGDSLVDESRNPAYEETSDNFWEQAASAMSKAQPTTKPPSSLLSFTPSRPIFPRGFLWDEGFHLLPVLEYDFDLAVTVLQSWLSLMDSDGWIAREQILGPEARSKVPREFQTQYPHFANPPTLILLASTIVAKANRTSPYRGHHSTHLASDASAKALLEELYPFLRRHYYWFRRTQAGDMTSHPRPEGANRNEAYRWRGRTRTHCLTSGLDDYPRPEPPHPGELHVDALSWVTASAATLNSLASYLGHDNDATTHAAELAAGKANLDALHWDEASQAYCDAKIHDSAYTTECHVGYITILPLLLGLLDASHPRLPAVLNTLSDPGALWSPHGLRSLSAAHAKYRKGEDYWRGAVWMNINTLAILRLWDLGETPGPQQARARDLAGRLRRNVVDTVMRSWEKTGFAWEQYDDSDGAGRRSRAFTGWTACVLLVFGIGEDVAAGKGYWRGEGFGVDSGWLISGQLAVSGCFLGLSVMVFRRKLWASGRGVVAMVQGVLGR